MFKGLDTTDALTQFTINELADQKYRFLIKYCANSAEYPNKRLSHVERSMCVAAGIKNGFVFERGDTYPYFSADQGKADAATALANFGLLGVPSGVTCFFAVDFDATLDQINGAITDYAEAFHTMLKAAGYLTGVYGSGLTCETLKDVGYVHWTWKAQSTKWEGFGFNADVTQGLGSVLNLASDPDTATTLGWAW